MLFPASPPEIRHAEELSLARPLEDSHLKFNYGERSRSSSTVVVTNGKPKSKRRITLPSMNGGGQNGHHPNGHHHRSTHSLMTMEPSSAAATR